MMNDSTLTSASQNDDYCHYDPEYVDRKLFHTRLLLIAMALIKMCFYLYCLLLRLHSEEEITAQASILIAFAIAVELIGLLAVIASNLLCTCIYFILILIQMTISSIYPQNPQLALNLLAHIVDIGLIARFLFKLNQYDDSDSGNRQRKVRKESESVSKEDNV